MVIAPLANKRIVVTRSQQEAAGTINQLTQLGATAIAFPTIKHIPLLAAIETLERYDFSQLDWLLLTSRQAVLYVAPFLSQLPPSVQIAVSGSQTAAVLRRFGQEPAIIPDSFIGESLVAAIGDIRGKHILFPRAKQGRQEIIDQLFARGGMVKEIPLYDTVSALPDLDAFNLLAQGVDCITFTSPTTVRYFVELTKEKHISATIACIGTVTAAEATKQGFVVDIIPETFTVNGLITAIVQYYAP